MLSNIVIQNKSTNEPIAAYHALLEVSVHGFSHLNDILHLPKEEEKLNREDRCYDYLMIISPMMNKDRFVWLATLLNEIYFTSAHLVTQAEILVLCTVRIASICPADGQQVLKDMALAENNNR